MTMEKEKKRNFFWRKSHSQQNIGQAQAAEAVPGSQDTDQITMQPDSPTEFVEKDVNFTSAFMPFVKNYVANLSHHQSVNKLPYPPTFYYPASSLQHQMNLQMQNVDVLVGANSLATPQERFLAVLKYTLSTCSLTKFPYKPIIAFLGETAQSFTSHGSDTTFYLGEQVEREPSTCAFYISNPSRGVVHQGNVALVPKFKQAHVHVSFVGQRSTTLTHPEGLWKETYVGDVPDLMIRILRMHTELGGSFNLSCNETGFAASVQFKDKPLFGGMKNAVAGKVTLQGREIFQIEGAWDGVTYLVDSATHNKVELLNRSTQPKLKVETPPLEQQPETSGERQWGPLIDTLHRRDFEQAKVVKAQLDVEQKERLAQFEANGGFAPTKFNKVQDGVYQIKDPNLAFPSGGPQM